MSNCRQENNEPYQLVLSIDVHESVQQIQYLDPDNSDVRLTLSFLHFQLHERLTQQGCSSQPCLRHPSGVSVEDLWFQQLVYQREDDAVKGFLHLRLVRIFQQNVLAEQDSLEVCYCRLTDLPRRVDGLSFERGH